MKLVVVLACGALALADAAAAQPPPASSSPAAAPAPTSAPAASAKPDSFGLDTPIETIAADPAGKAVLEKDLPGLLEHPLYENFKAMGLQDVAPLSNGQITDAALAQTRADLAAVRPSR